MKKTISVILMAMAAGLSFGALTIEVDDGHCSPDRQGKFCVSFGVEMDPQADVTLGFWHLNLDKCKALADEKHIPMIAIWSNTGCSHCQGVMNALMSDTFFSWRTGETAMPPMILVFMEGGTSGNIYTDSKGKHNHEGGAEYKWCWGPKKETPLYPFVAFYWNKGDGEEAKTLFTHGEALTKTYKGDKGAENFIAKANEFFAGWTGATDSYLGGSFVDPDTDGNRLEFESGTKSVTVNLSRTSKEATNVTFVVKGPTGAELESETVNWAADETNKAVEVSISAQMKSACTEDGQQLSLYLVDGDKAMATNHITYVAREPSAGNPLWLGERKAPNANGVAPDLEFGEWTMDFNLATQVVGKASGAAYTLVSLQGSLWCHDCANTDRNFLEVKDDKGNNRFCAWAQSKQIALVSMDIPNYNEKGLAPETVSSPTLFSKKAFSTTLAYEGVKGFYDVSKGGADPSLTNATLRSGLGYLTRKNATDEQAAGVMAKFHDLAVTNTDKGGFHRPEDTNAYRTGVPIFVLLRKDGTVAARFTRFASASPMAADQANFDNYVKRFDEMLAIAASTGEHADSSEIENNYPGDKAISFAANGGTAKGELCNADFQDAFKLTGVGGNADQKVTVKGESDAQVSVQFWQKAADGSFKTLGASAKGKLSDGVDLTQSFTEGGDYYLLVKGVDITSDAFDAASSTANHFIGFEVKGSTVLVPQEDSVTANAPADSDKVTIRLKTDVIYCFTGVTTNDNPFLIEIAEASPYRFLQSAVAGDVELKISTGKGGEIGYQIWKPGQVGFVETARSVPESVNDENDDWVEFQVARTGGKSGRVKARVSVDESSTLGPDRYELATNALNAVDFVWEDGVTSNMTVRVKIIDDEFYDGDFTLAFNLEVLASDAGDVTVVDGKSSFVLTILEDDKNTPGRCLIAETTPSYARKGTVYVREGEGAKIWVERIEASSGLVKAELVSSVSGTTFETEDPRDLTNDFGRVYVYWSSREMTKKYVQVGNIPAGKSARIQLKSVDTFKSVSASNAVTVVSVADDAPQFKEASYSFDLYRYLPAGGVVKAPLDETMLQGGKVTFTKLSGALPAGLKAAYDEATKSLVFAGKVTAKPGVYTVVYQVAETREGKKVPGLTASVTFTVVDPTDEKTNPEANPAVAKSRTIKDIAVVSPDTQRLAGVLQLTIPTKGNLSGKYVSEKGTISLTAKNWDSFDPATKTLSTTLSNAKTAVSVTVWAKSDYSLDISVDDLSGSLLAAKSDGLAWSSEASADWSGYYTVALPVETVETNATDDFAPMGSGYLTLSFTSQSALKTGTVKWAGLLPSGTSVSGSSVLGIVSEGMSSLQVPCRWVNLPVFKKSTTDTLSAYLKIRDEASDPEVRASDRRVIWSADDVVSYWKHGERTTTAADYLVNLGVYGALYDKEEDLGACCLAYYQTQEMVLGFDVSKLAWTALGTPAPVPPVTVTVTEDTITADPDDLKTAGATMSFSRSTGVVSGSVKVKCGDAAATCSAKYKGVILTGWGEGCGCGPSAGLKVLPFVNGAFYFTDKLTLESGKKLSVKRGGAVSVDVAE